MRHLLLLPLQFALPRLAVVAVALCAAAAGATRGLPPSPQESKPKAPVDDANPRVPSAPLVIELEPFWCSRCAKEGRGGERPADLDLWHRPPEKMAELIGVDPAKWIVLETPHFKIVTTLKGAKVALTDSPFVRADLERLHRLLPEVKVGSSSADLDAHQRAHLYQVRAEREYAHFLALCGSKKPLLGMEGRYELYLFDDLAPHQHFCERFLGIGHIDGGVLWRVPEKPTFILFTTNESTISRLHGKGEAVFANHVYHNVAHCLVDGVNLYLRETPAWIEEGLGHYYSRRESPRFNNFCWAEGEAPSELVKPDWEATLAALLRRNKDPSFPQWCDKLEPGELEGIESGLAWGLVKWLIESEPVRFAAMLDLIDDKQKNLSGGQMIEAAFGCTPSVLYGRWREHVLKSTEGK